MPTKPTYEELEQRVFELEKDSSELKKTQTALVENRERLDLALKNTELGIWDYDLKRDEWVFDERSLEFFESYPKKQYGIQSPCSP